MRQHSIPLPECRRIPTLGLLLLRVRRVSYSYRPGSTFEKRAERCSQSDWIASLGTTQFWRSKEMRTTRDCAREFKTVNGIPGHGGAIDVAGPVVANGMVYAVSGYPSRGALPGNVLIAFSTEP